jgi:FMN-dependent NADH-azoreductase
MNILHLDSSALGDHSASRELTRALVDALVLHHPQARVTHVDFDAESLPHLTGRSLAKADPAEVARAERMLEDFLAADVLVIGAPMYNFAIPSTLKAWIDRVTVAGRTFRYTARGPEGLAIGKRAILAISQGGVYGADGPDRFHQGYLEYVLAFVGVTDVHTVRAAGLALSPDHRQRAMAEALNEARRIAALPFARDHAA